jgi:preprotein translocase subunit SecD
MRAVLLGSLLALLTACAGSKHEDEAVREADERPILQFAPVAGPDDMDVREYVRGASKVRLAAPRTFEFQYVAATVDRLGHPALRFEVRELQKNVFESWTASLVGRELAILVDGEIVTMPRVVSPLPGEGIIEFGAARKSEAEVKSLADRIRAQSEKNE